MSELEKIQRQLAIGQRLLTLGGIICSMNILAWLVCVVLALIDGCQPDLSSLVLFSNYLMIGLALSKFGARLTKEAALTELDFYYREFVKANKR